MWLVSLRNYDGDRNGNGNENVNWKEKAFIKENNNSGLFQAFRQWRVARNGERREKKEALSPYSHPLSTYSHPLFPPYPTPSLPTPTLSFLLTPPPLYLLPPPPSSLPHPLSSYPHPLSPKPHSLSPYPYRSSLLSSSSLFFAPFRYLNVWNRLILAHFDSVTALLRSEIS